MTTEADPSSGDATLASPVTAELLHLEQSTFLESNSHRFSPLVSWLVATARPALSVELGPGDEASLRSTCDAVARLGDGSSCAAVLLPSGPAAAADQFQGVLQELGRRFGGVLDGYEDEGACLRQLHGTPVGLVHLSLFDSDDMALPDFGAWDNVLAPGGVMVVTTTASDVSAKFAEAKRHLMDTYRAVPISLGLTTEAVVAQRPAEDATPIADMLRTAPFAVGAFLVLFGEQVELHHVLQHEPEPSEAVRALVGRVIDQQHAEREAFITALRVYKEETARLSGELVETRNELSHQIEAARQERGHLVSEFLDRVDELSSKVSTTASRYSAELADKEALLEAEGRRVEAYAGQAATAQSVIEDIHQSTSWRITAPVRLFSRMLARRAQPEH